MVVSTAARRHHFRRWLVRLASSAPVRVFAIEAMDPPLSLEDLRAHQDLRFVDSPRSANVLLVAGRLPAALHQAFRRVHDMMSHPRATVWARPVASREGELAPLALARLVEPGDDLVETLRRTHRELLTGDRQSDPPILPDEEPAPWRGVGPYGQGGTGMTGGVPYGRPMTGRAADRDGLELDQLPVRVGPFFGPFPTGFVLDVRLQGDIIQEVTVDATAFVESPIDGGVPSAVAHDPFRRALSEPVLVADIEIARARHHLRWLAHALRVQGLDMLARRVLGLLPTLAPAAINDVVALRRHIDASRLLTWGTATVGVLSPSLLEGLAARGPVARASGLRQDARVADATYSALGYEPVTQPDGDVRARWRQRLAEIAQSLHLAQRAGDRHVERVDAIEAPHGPVLEEAAAVDAQLKLLPRIVPGMEWGDAVATVVSLDIDLRIARASDRATAQERTSDAKDAE